LEDPLEELEGSKRYANEREIGCRRISWWTIMVVVIVVVMEVVVMVTISTFVRGTTTR
jgi:t-SNARE complex subunit (syntaxin)